MRTRVGVNHPEHGPDLPVIPDEQRGWAGFKARRACRKKGGHWWDPVDPMIGWGCCNCGARTDGCPWDGS